MSSLKRIRIAQRGGRAYNPGPHWPWDWEVRTMLLAQALAAQPDWLAVGLRVLHIAAAITAGGAALFQLVAVHPVLKTLEESQRLDLRERIARRWREIVFGAIAVLLFTGLLNYVLYKIPEYKPVANKGLYHGLLGIKILLALAAFHAASVLAIPAPAGLKYRARTGFWLKYLVVLFALIVTIGGVLRYFKDVFPAALPA